MLVRLPARFISKLCIALLVLCCLSSCSLFDTTSGVGQIVVPTPTATPVGVAVPVCHELACTNLAPVSNVRAFPDTWQNIHRFQLFDFNVTDRVTLAKNVDFIWGADAQPAHLYTYRYYNPNIVLSYYMPMNTDNGRDLTNTDSGKRGPTYWVNQGHRDWLLYQCDGTTPVQGFATGNAIFRLDDPDVLNWQLATYIRPADALGYYDALAIDNVDMENLFHACGYYNASGQWVQRYTGKENDPAWQSDVQAWITSMQTTLHALPNPMELIANFSYGGVGWNTATTQQTLAHTDGMLDEASFTHFGDYSLYWDMWQQTAQRIATMQRQNKPYFVIDQFNEDNQHINPDEIQWALASYLLCKQRLAYLFISQHQGYGLDYNDLSQYKIQIGNPSGDMYMSQGIYWRDFTAGKVLLNSTDNPVTITLNGAYVDLTNSHINASLTLPAHTARILLATS